MYFTPHLDENAPVFVQIYTFYPTFGRKSFDIIYYCPVNCFQDIDMVVFIIYPAPYGKESCQSNQSVCWTVNRIAIHKPKNLVHRRGDTARPQRQAESHGLAFVTLSALHPAFCLCCIQKNIAGYFVRSELFVIFARRFPYENINISYEGNIIFH